MDVFIGFISPFPYNFAPLSWAKCEGQILAVAQYNALFALLGTNFGGNGTSNFGLPDLRGRLPIGAGAGPGLNFVDFAEKSGMNSVTLTPAQTPLAAHTHPATFTPTGGGSLSANLSVSTEAPTVTAPLLANGETAYLANAAVGGNLKGLYTKTAPAPGATATIPANVSGGSGGGTVAVGANTITPGTPVSVMNPYLALNFCIAMTGLFPSRN